jgi:hypothetical protein
MNMQSKKNASRLSGGDDDIFIGKGLICRTGPREADVTPSLKTRKSIAAAATIEHMKLTSWTCHDKFMIQALM